MHTQASPSFSHPSLSRRQWIQAGAVSLLGLGMPQLDRLRAETESTGKSVIFIFLSGGLAQHESFDPKPLASSDIRGEFGTIATRTPGYRICEHLPQLAQRSDRWSVVRSLTHPYNEHSQGHMAILSGRTEMPTGFNPQAPKPTDHPSIAAIASDVTAPKNNLPPAIVLPEKLIHRTGRVIPGQFAGTMGPQRDPYFLECCRFNAATYGAWPEYGFHHQRGEENPDSLRFQLPSLQLPEAISQNHFEDRSKLLEQIQQQQIDLQKLAEVDSFDRFQQRALSMLADTEMGQLFNVTDADEKTLDRYGRHTFGWSLLLARRLVEAGVGLVQVNLGNNETWDTHGNAFPNLKNYLLPPMDQSVSALLDDLTDRGLLDDTLVVMAGEFGRTPTISHLPQHYALPGRDHWGEVQSILLAGGGIQGGRVIGSTDALGGSPVDQPVTPENLAATIYRSLGIPPQSTWADLLDRPMPVYHDKPISGLT